MLKMLPQSYKTLFLLWLHCLLVLTFVMSGLTNAAEPPAGAQQNVALAEHMTICRQPDPLIISGAKLRPIIGLTPELIGLYSLREGKLEPIPFQIDSKDADDKYIMLGLDDKDKVAELPIDLNDELVFMARDLGDRCPPELYPEAFRQGVEIEITDPLTGARGWSYLFTFNQPAPRSEFSYTRYLYPRNGKDIVDTNAFAMEFPPVEDCQANSVCGLRVKTAAGGSGENFLDRMKMRVNFQMLFSFIKFSFTEETLGSVLMAYKEGPVQILRRNKLYIPLGFGLKSPGFSTDMYVFETIMQAPMDMTIPFRFGHVFTNSAARFGFDYRPNVKGSKFYNSLNLEGFTIDGTFDDAEKNMNHGEAAWNMLTGPMGTIMRRSIRIGTTQKQYFNIHEYVIDNESEPDPPENVPGNIGHTYQLWDVTDLPRGKYLFQQYFFVVPHFQWGDQYEYVKIHDNPLEVVTRGLAFSQSQIDTEEHDGAL